MTHQVPCGATLGQSERCDGHYLCSACREIVALRESNAELMEVLENTATALERYDSGHPYIAEANIAMCKASGVTDTDARQECYRGNKKIEADWSGGKWIEHYGGPYVPVNRGRWAQVWFTDGTPGQGTAGFIPWLNVYKYRVVDTRCL